MAFSLSYFVSPQMSSYGVVPSGIYLQDGILVQQVQYPQVFSHTPVFAQTPVLVQKEYDYSVFLIMTKNHMGQYQLLIPCDNFGNLSLYEQKIYNSDNPDIVMEKIMNFYGLSSSNINHIGKFTKMKHFEKTTGLTYKIGILYMECCSISNFNNRFQSINGNSYQIIPVNFDYFHHKMSLLVSNVIYAIKNMIYQLI